MTNVQQVMKSRAKALMLNVCAVLVSVALTVGVMAFVVIAGGEVLGERCALGGALLDERTAWVLSLASIAIGMAAGGFLAGSTMGWRAALVFPLVAAVFVAIPFWNELSGQYLASCRKSLLLAFAAWAAAPGIVGTVVARLLAVRTTINRELASGGRNVPIALAELSVLVIGLIGAVGIGAMFVLPFLPAVCAVGFIMALAVLLGCRWL